MRRLNYLRQLVRAVIFKVKAVQKKTSGPDHLGNPDRERPVFQHYHYNASEGVFPSALSQFASCKYIRGL
jgi:hypothetical protein